jgi:hypothetical protein
VTVTATFCEKGFQLTYRTNALRHLGVIGVVHLRNDYVAWFLRQAGLQTINRALDRYAVFPLRVECPHGDRFDFIHVPAIDSIQALTDHIACFEYVERLCFGETVALHELADLIALFQGFEVFRRQLALPLVSEFTFKRKVKGFRIEQSQKLG